LRRRRLRSTGLEDDSSKPQVGLVPVPALLVLWAQRQKEVEEEPQLMMVAVQHVASETEPPVEMPMLHGGQPYYTAVVRVVVVVVVANLDRRNSTWTWSLLPSSCWQAWHRWHGFETEEQ
jgi:hypothetical protein